MIFTSKLATFAALSAASLSVIPVARSATIDVVVGGPGVLKFDPEFIVRSHLPASVRLLYNTHAHRQQTQAML